MDPKVLTTVLVNVLAPIGTTVLGVVGVALQDWWTRRSDLGRRRLVLEDAVAQVGFVREWCAAHQALDGRTPDGAQAARRWLDEASAVVAAHPLRMPDPGPPMTWRRFALLYPFTSTAGKVARAGFFCCAGLTVLISGATISQQLADEPNNPRWVLYDLISGATLATLTLTLRFLAPAVDTWAGRPPAPGHPSYGVVRRALLLHPLAGAGARLARAGFYLMTLGLIVYVVYYAQLTVLYEQYSWVPQRLAAVLVYGTAALGLRFWAGSIDRAAQPLGPHGQEA